MTITARAAEKGGGGGDGGGKVAMKAVMEVRVTA